jgi:hypothetical protein
LHTTEGMSAEQNKNLVRRFFEEAWGKGKVAVDEFMATGYLEHPLPSGLPPGPEGLKQLIVANRSAFPDLKSAGALAAPTWATGWASLRPATT